MLQILISSPQKRPAMRRGGFTLIEILVAVAIMSLLLGIILVPLRLGFETYHIGKARAEVQQEAQLTLQQIGTDLRRAKFIFPNSLVQNVSNNQDTTSPCSSAPYKGQNPPPAVPDPTDWKFLPYAKAKVAPTTPTNSDPAVVGPGLAGSDAWSNPARIDMLLTRRNDINGISSDVGEDYIVSYYSRRLDISKAYDIVDNPVVLFRAQYPFRYYSTTAPIGFQPFAAPTPLPGQTTPSPGPYTTLNAETNWRNYPDSIGTTSDAETDRKFLWIRHNYYGEANLEPLARDASSTVAGAHTLATPFGMGLVAPRDANISTANSAEALVPELSFTQEATTGSRINRVKIGMTLAIYDQAGAGSVNGQGKAQRVRVSQTFDLPNAGCTP